MPETIACDLCGSGSSRLMYARRDYRLRVDEQLWHLVRCDDCGFGYLNPRPTPDEAGRYYPRAYFAKRAADVPRYQRLAGYVPGPPGRLLDVGTADGHFLEVMRDRGWDVAGVEPGGSRPAGDTRGLDIRYGPFPAVSSGFTDGSFDVITAWAVFEHLHEPAAAFAECARLLRPGGRLIIEVPNLRSPAARTPIKEDVPRHLNFFEPETLRRFGERSGLELGAVHHTPELFSGSNRGVLRYHVLRALGRSTDEYFEMLQTRPRGRFRRWPILATVWTLTSLIEHVVLADAVVRRLRISSEIVADFSRVPAATPFLSPPAPVPVATPGPPAAGPPSG